MKFKGTKGRWFACCPKSKPHFVFSEGTEESVCTMNWKNLLNEDIPIAEIQANALIISKAPEMLEILKKCDKTFNGKFQTLHKEIKQLIKESTEIYEKE